MPTASELLRKYNVRAQKRLGQSFLVDHNIISKIVRTAAVKPNDTVVEIGAGIGILTAALAGQARKVVAVEIDPVMVGILREELKDLPNIDIVQADILKYDFRSAAEGSAAGRIKVVGNIPYNISTQILFRLIGCRDIVSDTVLMFQKEVADRLSAPPGGKEFGIPTVLTGMFARITREISVPASCFSPPPRVDSVVVKISFYDAPAFRLEDEDFFTLVVKAAFSQRRKTLLNNLKSARAMGLPPAAVEKALKQVGIDGKRRGETLSVEEFGRLSNALHHEARHGLPA